MARATRARAEKLGPSLADDALALARTGFAVFPCNPDKSPRTPRGFHDASTDPDVVAGMDWNGAMIGAAIPEGHVVIDVDPRNGGDETIAALKKAGHRLPRTRIVRTGSGGTHYYFLSGAAELRAHLGEGVDVKRAGKGYVIVPPSEGYKLVRPDAPVRLPVWLMESLAVPEKSGEAAEASEPKFLPFEDGTRYGLKARAGILEELAEARPGSRNDALNRAAFSLAQLVAGGELHEEKTLAALEETALDAGLTPAETQKTIRSGWEAGSEEPRQAPPREPVSEVKTPGLETLDSGSVPDGSHFWLDWTKDESPPAFMLDPVLPENAYVLVYGPAEASKSMVWNALGAEASRRGIKTTVYSLENPPHVDRDRIRRLGPDPEFFRATNEPLDMNDPTQFKSLIAREADWGTRLLVIDTYSHAFGSRSEDGNARAVEFGRRVRFLMHEVGCSVVVIDHTGYAHDEPRDASAKRQQVDVCILMTSIGKWEPGRDAEFAMENRKAARFGNPFEFRGKIRGKRGEPLELAWASGKAPEWVK